MGMTEPSDADLVASAASADFGRLYDRSEQVVRKRVSRGLAGIRASLEGQR